MFLVQVRIKNIVMGAKCRTGGGMFPSLDALLILLKYQDFSLLECLRPAHLTPKAAAALAGLRHFPTGGTPIKSCCKSSQDIYFLLYEENSL
jgi:hypothetical protein